MSKALISVTDAEEAEAEKLYVNFSKREPVRVAGLTAGPLTWLMANVGAFVVGHTHLVTKAQWNVAATAAFPTVSALVVGLITWLFVRLLRNAVSPAWKLLTGRTLSAAPLPTPSVAYPPPASFTGGFNSTAWGGGGGSVASSSPPTVPGEADLFDADLSDGPDEITGSTSGAPGGAEHDPNTPGSSAPPMGQPGQ